MLLWLSSSRHFCLPVYRSLYSPYNTYSLSGCEKIGLTSSGHSIPKGTLYSVTLPGWRRHESAFPVRKRNSQREKMQACNNDSMAYNGFIHGTSLLVAQSPAP